VVPANAPPSSVTPVSVVVSMDSFNSNYIGTNGSNDLPGGDQFVAASSGVITTIYVK
jgi:hypothetical protein